MIFRPIAYLFAALLLVNFNIANAENAFEGTQGDVTRSALPIYGGGVEDLKIASNGNIYAGLGSPNGIFCSTDGASTWSGPPTGSDFGSVSAVAVGSQPETVFIIAGIDMFLSTDSCATWQELSASGANDFGQSMAYANGILMAAFRDGTVQVSTNDGTSFTSRAVDENVNSVDSVASGTTEGLFFALITSGSTKKLYKTTDSGTNWTELVSFSEEVSEIGVDPNDEDTLVATGVDVALISTNGGTSFTEVTPEGMSQSRISFATVSSNQRIYVGASYTEDNGANWTNTNDSATTDSELRGDIVTDPSDSTMFFMASNRGVAKSSDSTATWSDSVTGMLGVQVAGIAQATDKNIVYLAALGGVARTDDYLNETSDPSWTYPLDVVGNGTSPTAIIIPDPDSPATVLAAAFNGIYRSTDSGASWTATTTDSVLENRDEVTCFTKADGGTLYAGFQNADDNSGGVAVSNDGGLTWTDAAISNDPPVNALVAVDSVLFAGVGSEGTTTSTQRGIYQMASGSWTQLTGAFDGMKINDLIYTGNAIFASAGDVASGGLYRSTDMGTTWGELSSSFTEVRCFQTLAFDPDATDDVYVAFGCPAGTAVIYRSENGGDTWSTFYTGLKDEVPSAMLFDDLIVGLNTGAFEFNDTSEVTSSIASITLTKRTRKTKKGKRKHVLTATAKDSSNQAVVDENVQLQFKRKKKRAWTNRGASKTLDSAGDATWKTKTKGFYRVVAESDEDIASSKKRLR